MKLLHINLNYEKSRIHHNIVCEMNKQSNIDGRIFYPIKINSKQEYGVAFLDVIRCLKKHERFFLKLRNTHLLNVATKFYNFGLFDHLLAHSLFSNGLLAMSLAEKNDLSYSVIVTNTDMNLYFSKLWYLRSTGLRVLQNAHRIFFSSIVYRDEMIRKYVPDRFKMEIAKKSVSVPFGVDDFWIKNRKEKDRTLIGKFIRLLYVGKINKNKNVTLTVEACKKLIENGLKIQYTIVGDASGNEGDKILNNVIKNNFVKHIPSIGFEELLEIYRSNDIFIMPSIAESFGLVYAEAMTQGVPVIYTRGQGFDKQFEDNFVGVPVRSDSTEDIVKAIEVIKNNYNNISSNAYNYSLSFSWSIISERFLKEIIEDY